MFRKMFCFVLALCCAMSLFSIVSAEEVLKIGVIGPMTGGAAVYGNAVANGARIAAEEINALGFGVAKVDGMVIFVGQGAPEDVARVRVIKVAYFCISMCVCVCLSTYMCMPMCMSFYVHVRAYVYVSSTYTCTWP